MEFMGVHQKHPCKSTINLHSVLPKQKQQNKCYKKHRSNQYSTAMPKPYLARAGFLLFARCLISTPVFFYTRAGARTISKKLKISFVTLLAITIAAFASQFIAGSHTPKAYAASSNTLNFQARLETSAGAIVPDGTYSIVFNIYNASSGGSSLWNETKSITTINGYLTATLGDTSSLTSLNWNQDMWITMKVGTDPEMSPRLKLTAVPYAIQALQLQSTVGTGTGTLSFSSMTCQSNN
jgi:hypothetical protein